MSDRSAWPALVLTAGLATRLRPLSDVRAKAALPLAGKPLISRILQWLRSAGVRRVVLNLHHRPETITRLVGDGAPWGVDVRYSWEPRVLGSAGGPRRALELLDANRFFIVNGDTLTDCDLRGLADRHLTTGARVTMAVVRGDVGRYGGVLVRPDGWVAGFSNASAGASATGSAARPLHFIGVQAVNADAFDGVPDDAPSETVRTLYPALIAANTRALAAFESAAEFLDVGTPADYYQTVATIAAREQVPLDHGEAVVIEPGAEVEHTILWDRVRIGRHARLRNCIVTDDVCVPGSVSYDNSVITASNSKLAVHPL
jgi:mannose-1-phosphate guanylyltransferase